jgi:DNA repair exonuclease SbcCD ATPase subunit
MRLRRLALEDWRGVASQEVALANGVTIIEGPNEIGKSTIVEAVRLLFSELDSSKKQGVKSIQPVGRDVGSRVEAEVEAGDYHFVYSKTYNKSPQTSLDIKAPVKQQLTGREAHERVAEILTETVDMALWAALLVDQGEKVGLANIQESTGLANALDEAAGSSAAEIDDSDLFAAVQTEYEKYFTLKTGKLKFTDKAKARESAEAGLEDSKQSLVDIENDSIAHDRSAAESHRLEDELPSLKKKAEEQAKAWQVVSTLQQKFEDKEREVNTASELQFAAINVHGERQKLIESIADEQAKFTATEQALAPQREKVADLKALVTSAQLVIDDLKNKSKSARKSADLAQRDESYMRQRADLSVAESALTKLDANAKQMQEALEVTTRIKVEDESLEQIRDAEKAVDLAKARRDLAATTVSVTARKTLQFEFDGSQVDLQKDQDESRIVAAEISIRIPGVADIQISPSQSVAELQDEVDDAASALEDIRSKLGIGSLQEAIAANEKLNTAKAELKLLKERESELLDDASITEIKQQKKSLEIACNDYQSSRPAEPKIPDTLSEAQSRVAELEAEREKHDIELELARTKDEEHRKTLESLNLELGEGEREVHSLGAMLKEKTRRLAETREQDTDAVLQGKSEKTAESLTALQVEAATVAGELKNASPDAVQALLENSDAVLERAKSDLRSEQTKLAVLTDRLEQAQANGRFEAMEVAERAFEESSAKLEAIQRRATAAELLWITINKHRDETRKAFVRPLKDAIERLGRIVFGGDFEVEIGDDWSLVSRSLSGITLPFEDLSVGAKEQLGILARLAAAQIVSTQGGVPLIMDDALGFSDPSRLETMGAAIAAAGKDTQIIILTCTPGRFTHVGSAEVVRF